MKLKQKQLTITGKKYFSTVPGVRTSAHDPKGLKYKSCLLFKHKSHLKQHKQNLKTSKKANSNNCQRDKREKHEHVKVC